MQDLSAFVSAVQHERKPISEKKEVNSFMSGDSNLGSFSNNPMKIFIRKDLCLESQQYGLQSAALGLGYMSPLHYGINTGKCNQDYM